MRRRRRPLARAAMVGGAGYVAGKKMGERGSQDADQEEQPPEEAEAQPEPAVAEDAAPAVGDDDMVNRLTQLKELHDSGVLTDEEFAAEKEKVLSGG